MDFDEEPFTVDRVDSFPQDRAYPSRPTRSHISKRATEDSQFSDRRLHHQGTGDFEPRRRLRYTIPLRHQSSSAGDEEKGYSEKSPYGRAFSTPLGIDRENSRDPAASPPPEFLEIISTKWVPDDESREIVTLTVKDEGGNQKQEDIHCESRWKHIQSDATTIRQLYKEVTRTPGLSNDDLALVGRLLDKVRKISEKKFVHGRYLKPITLVYEGEDPDRSASHRPEERQSRKIATFVSLPVFTFSGPKRHMSTKESEGHPVRALLQSRYRLESTKRRDKEQVITKIASIRDHLAHENHIVHVPHIWALMINNYTIITCADLDVSVLRGDTIKLMSYTEAQKDEATWSVHFTDARGKDFYLPLRSCKTWFDLVRQITDHCLHDEWDFIRDQLLKGGQVYQLVVDNEEIPVNAERWSKLVEETKTEVIHLRLVDNENISSRLLVTYYDDEGHEIITDPSSDEEEEEDSDASESSQSSGTSSNDMSRAIERLRTLQTKLREAESKGRAKRVAYLKEHKIPTLEERMLDLAAVGLDLDTSNKDDSRRKSRISIPGPNGHQTRSGHGTDHDSPLSPTERHRARLRSRSRSASRSRFVKGGTAFSGSAHDLSMKEPSARGRTSQPYGFYDRKHSTSPRRIFRDVEYGATSRGQPHIRSHMANAQSLSRKSTLSIHSGSRWDLLRSRVRQRQLPGLRGNPTSPMVERDDIYYRPSEKQLARSYWDLVRSTVLDGGIQKLRNAEAAKNNEDNIDQATAGNATTSDRVKRGLAKLRRLSDAPDGLLNASPDISPTTVDPSGSTLPLKPPNDPAKGMSVVNQGKIEPIKPKKVLFSKHSLESKPKLKKLIKLAQESTIVSKIGASPAAHEVSSPVSAHSTTDPPIFLWSTDHKQESRSLFHNLEQLPTVLEASTSKPSPQKSAEEVKQVVHTSKTEELILHAVLAEVHLALKKPKRGTPEYAALYEKTTEKTYADVVGSVNALRKFKANGTDRPTMEERNNSVSNLRRASLAFAGIAQRRTESTRSLPSSSGQDDPGLIKLEIFDQARIILHAFVPKGYEAAVISKYWGALHSLLMKASLSDVVIQICTNPPQEDTVLEYVRSRLSEICNLIQSIQVGVRAEDGGKQQRYQIPRALPAAFQHLVLLLVVISSISNWSDYSWGQMRSAFDDCESYLVEGRKQLLLMIHTDDYRDSSGFQAVDSEALLSLILANLISSMSPNGDFQLTEVYAEYTTDIQRIVRDSASVKVGHP